MEGFDEYVFERAAQLVDQGWSQGTSARDASGTPVRWDSPEARSFCAMGAVARALHDSGWWCQEVQSAALSLMAKSAVKLGARSIQNWNDDPERRDGKEVSDMLRSVMQ